MRNMAVARVLGVLAIVLLPLFAIFGWWTLAVSGVLAVAAALLRPRPATHVHPDRLRHLRDALRRRFTRHAWRPGRR